MRFFLSIISAQIDFIRLILMILSNFGRIIATARKQKKLSGEAVSSHLGISRQHLSKIECGKVNVTLPMFFKVCHLLCLDAGRVINALEGRTAPGFSSPEYDNEKLAQLSFEHALLVHAAIQTIPDGTTDVYWLGTVIRKKSPFQVQLLITGDASAMVDES